MPSALTAALGLLLACAGAVGLAYVVGQLVEHFTWKRRTREQQAAPQYQVIDAGNKTDLRPLLRRARTLRMDINQAPRAPRGK